MPVSTPPAGAIEAAAAKIVETGGPGIAHGNAPTVLATLIIRAALPELGHAILARAAADLRNGGVWSPDDGYVDTFEESHANWLEAQARAYLTGEKGTEPDGA